MAKMQPYRTRKLNVVEYVGGLIASIGYILLVFSIISSRPLLFGTVSFVISLGLFAIYETEGRFVENRALDNLIIVTAFLMLLGGAISAAVGLGVEFGFLTESDSSGGNMTGLSIVLMVTGIAIQLIGSVIDLD